MTPYPIDPHRCSYFLVFRGILNLNHLPNSSSFPFHHHHRTFPLQDQSQDWRFSSLLIDGRPVGIVLSWFARVSIGGWMMAMTAYGCRLGRFIRCLSIVRPEYEVWSILLGTGKLTAVVLCKEQSVYLIDPRKGRDMTIWHIPSTSIDGNGCRGSSRRS